jgi:hypothetical protein
LNNLLRILTASPSTFIINYIRRFSYKHGVIIQCEFFEKIKKSSEQDVSANLLQLFYRPNLIRVAGLVSAYRGKKRDSVIYIKILTKCYDFWYSSVNHSLQTRVTCVMFTHVYTTTSWIN